MRVGEHIERLDAESNAFVALAGEASLGDPIPGCDGWAARDCILHVGELFHWSSELVASRRLDMVHPAMMGTTLPDDDTVVDWIVDAREQMLATFRATDLSEPVWGWAGDHRGWFWPRRMLFEVAVHKTDLQRGTGHTPALDDDLIVEGVDEHLSILPWTAVTDPGVGNLRGEGESIGLRATSGPCWRIVLLPGGIVWDRSTDETTATVTGALFDLYMHTQGRPNRCEVTGDTDLHERTLGRLSF